MKRLIAVNVFHNQTAIKCFLCSVDACDGTDVDRNQLTLSRTIGDHNCRQITVRSDFCQTVCFVLRLNSSLDYRRIVFNNLKLFAQNVGPKVPALTHELTSGDDIDGKCDEIGQLITINIKLKTLDHMLAIDKNWNQSILQLVAVRHRVEDSLSWLSTLGGAYSSLGEYNVHCAVKAGEISVSQLRLATITGDPNLVAKCGIFMAFSLCQQKKKKTAVRLIRRTIHPFVKNIPNCDKIVASMYSALCYRIKNTF